MIGGLLSMAADNGQRVACLTATKGEAGVQDANRWAPEQLGDIRAKELAAALEILGVGTHEWLGYRDGTCSTVNETEVTERLASYIDAFKPDSVITFPPDGLTGHDDHVAVSRWVTAAVSMSTSKPALWYAVHTQEIYDAAFKDIHDSFNVYFNIDMPKLIPASACDVVLSLPDESLAKKLRALKAMPSQYEAFFNGISQQDAELAFETEGLVRSTKWGDL